MYIYMGNIYNRRCLRLLKIIVVFTRKYVNRIIWYEVRMHSLRKEELYERGIQLKVTELVLSCVCNTRCLSCLVRIRHHEYASLFLFFFFHHNCLHLSIAGTLIVNSKCERRWRGIFFKKVLLYFKAYLNLQNVYPTRFSDMPYTFFVSVTWALKNGTIHVYSVF